MPYFSSLISVSGAVPALIFISYLVPDMVSTLIAAPKIA